MSAIFSLLAALLPLFSKLIDWFFSAEQIQSRQIKEAAHVSQDFQQALGNNNAVYITGACADLHDRVRTALRGH